MRVDAAWCCFVVVVRQVPAAQQVHVLQPAYPQIVAAPSAPPHHQHPAATGYLQQPPVAVPAHLQVSET